MKTRTAIVIAVYTVILVLTGCAAYEDLVLGTPRMDLNCQDRALLCAMRADRAGFEQQIWTGYLRSEKHVQVMVELPEVGWQWVDLDPYGCCTWVHPEALDGWFPERRTSVTELRLRWYTP